MQKLLLLLCVALGWLAGCCGHARADLVGVQYWDKSPLQSHPENGGPLWTGVVDTTADTLTIYSWRELQGDGINFWTPASLPMVWEAHAAGQGSFGSNLFDVPDSFGANGVIDFGDDGTPANDFAFVSPVSAQDMPWYAFNETTGEVDRSAELTFMPGASIPLFYPGWGGEAFIDPTNGLTFRVKQPNSSSNIEYDFQTMPFLPNSAINFGVASGAIVEVISPQLASVPEASSFIAVGLLATLSAGVCLLRKQRVVPLTASAETAMAQPTFARSAWRMADTRGRRRASSSSY